MVGSKRPAAPNPADPLDRILRALNHPIRRQILTQLSQGPASASVLAKHFDEELGIVSYHLNQVLARDCEVVELVDAVPKRGALEKIYGLDRKVWSHLSARSELECGVECFPMEVDSAVWEEICAARSDFEDRISAAVQSGEANPPGDQVIEKCRIIVGVGAFMTPLSSSGASENGAHPVGDPHRCASSADGT